MYPKEILLEIVKLAEQHDLILFSDEIYDRIIYDDYEHYALASSPRMCSVLPSTACPSLIALPDSGPDGWC